VTNISESELESEAESEVVWGRPTWAWVLVHAKQRAVKSSVGMANRRIVKASQENRKSSLGV
jgi:hypothetical protein